ncbi:MAG: hypothetical protein BGP06_12865 [Rhizobiales bacterium 65-9]|nr:hypothetical protein [Hyphomicrobiales bacterium]OJY37150.1 MAG: hypothetical protein BGP06_12865 [Rhizobiales bacterium 65-9]
MSTIFDFVTVAAFLALVAAYMAWGRGDQKLLMHLMVSAVAFAIANQLGNRGLDLFAVLVIAAGAGYAVMMFRGR